MSNEVEIKVTGENLSGPALKGAKDDTDKLGAAAEKTAVKLKAEQVEAGALERKLLALKATAAKLGEEFKRTGDTDVLKQFNKVTGEAGGIEKFTKDFDKLGQEAGKAAKETAKVAESVGKDVAKGAESAAKGVDALGSSVTAMPGAGQFLAIAAAVLAIPVAAAAAGAAMAGLGLAGIGVGIAGAVKQAPEIGVAFGNELDKVKAQWQQGSAAFIQPTLNVVKQLGDALNGLPIKKTLTELSQYTEGIGTGVASAVSSIGTGIANLIHDAAPVLKALGPDIAGLGHSIEEALNSIGSGAKGDAEALTQIIRVVGTTIEVVGALVGGFGKAFDAIDKFSHGVDDVFKKVSDVAVWLKPLSDWQGMWDDRKPAAFGSVLPGVSQSMGDLDAKTTDAATALAALNTQMSTAINQALGLENANVAVAAGFADLKKGIEGHARSLDLGSDAGRTNITVVTDMISKLEQLREKAIEAGDGTAAATDQANAAFSAQIDHLKANLIQLGFNKSAVDSLVDSLNKIPKDIPVNVKIRITQTGSTDVQGVVSGGIPRSGGYRHGGVVGAAAAGGPRSGRVLVGEDGPEIADLPTGTNMHTTGDSGRLLAGMGGGVQTIKLVVDASGAGDFGHALAAILRDYVHIQGGDGSVLGIS